jgi:hypothetical protein
MIRSKSSLKNAGKKKIRTRAKWDFEVDMPQDAELLDRLRVLKNMDHERCYWNAVVKDTSGAFFVIWKERHPKVPDPETFFAVPPGRGGERIAEYRKLVRRYRPTVHALKLTRRKAFQIVASFWLPTEFHADAGLTKTSSERNAR